jgi:hypothetical protein
MKTRHNSTRELPPSRPKGAQPGNKNAMKHGFYARSFNRQEINDLQYFSRPTLQPEIDMLRVVIRRVFEITAAVTEPAQALVMLNVMAHACASLNRMVYYQQEIYGPYDQFDETLREALDDLDEYRKGEDEKRRLAEEDARQEAAEYEQHVFTRLELLALPPSARYELEHGGDYRDDYENDPADGDEGLDSAAIDRLLASESASPPATSSVSAAPSTPQPPPSSVSITSSTTRPSPSTVLDQ